MAAKNTFCWHHLNQLRHATDITREEHKTTDLSIIQHHKKITRDRWKSCKKRSVEIRKNFLLERATYLASKMHTSEEKALKAIIKSEKYRHIYKNIKELFGKSQQIFTQVDVLSDLSTSTSAQTTLTMQTDIERESLARNRRHSLQSLRTPFLSNPILHESISPESASHHMDVILNGTF
jgi:hypothetical protein